MPAPPEPDPEVERLFALVRERYGDRLTPAELDDVRRDVAGVVLAARALRAVRLDNADAPFPPFVPYRERP
jgi:hypothetical protein